MPEDPPLFRFLHEAVQGFFRRVIFSSECSVLSLQSWDLSQH